LLASPGDHSAVTEENVRRTIAFLAGRLADPTDQRRGETG
jgi:hypothetical protein